MGETLEVKEESEGGHTGETVEKGHANQIIMNQVAGNKDSLTEVDCVDEVVAERSSENLTDEIYGMIASEIEERESVSYEEALSGKNRSKGDSSNGGRDWVST